MISVLCSLLLVFPVNLFIKSLAALSPIISPCWLIVDREGEEYLEITPSVNDIIAISFGTQVMLHLILVM